MDIHRDGQRSVNRNLNYAIARLRIAARVKSHNFKSWINSRHASRIREALWHRKCLENYLGRDVTVVIEKPYPRKVAVLNADKNRASYISIGWIAEFLKRPVSIPAIDCHRAAVHQAREFADTHP